MKLHKQLAISLLVILITIPSVAYAENKPEDSNLFKIIGQTKEFPVTSIKVNYKTVKKVFVSHSSTINLNQSEKTNKTPKIFQALQEKIDEFIKNNDSGKIEVSIMLNQNIKITKEQFINTIFATFKDSITNEEGLGGYNFFVELTPIEILEISRWDSISSLSIPEDVISVW